MKNDAASLTRLSAVVSRIIGLHFPQERWPELQRGITAAARDLGFGDDAEACARWLAGAPAVSKTQIESLAAHLTVGETYFFRERRHFDFLAMQVVPELIARGTRQLRIWSAGCCTGEEAYSIAIMLHRTIPDLDRWQVTLLATDINPRFLRKAQAGIFGPWSFRDVPDSAKAHYFRERPGGQLELLPEIRRLVRFAPLNLAEDTYPSLLNDTQAMDVIFCRNVLMYFSPELARKVVQKFHACQRENGWLIVGASELPHLSASSYASVNTPEGIVYRRAAATASAESRVGTVALDGGSVPVAGHCAPREDASLPEGRRTDDLRQRAAGFYAQGRYLEAADAINVLLSEIAPKPNDVADLLFLARCLANQGQLSAALDYCDRAIAADRCHAASHYLRALILQERGDTDQAIRSLRSVLFLDQQFVLAHTILGTLARDRGQLSEARKHLHHALEILHGVAPDARLLESEDMTAGQLTHMIRAIMEMEAIH